MGIYALQKLIKDINRKPDVRQAYAADPDEVIAKYDVDEAERLALRRGDLGTLYRLGVHGLLLRPFSILHSVSEQDYLSAIREGR